MKHILLISFDLIREGEPSTTLSIGYLISFLKNDKRYGNEFIANHVSFNIYNSSLINPNDIINSITTKYRLNDIDYIAISCYIWSDYIINPLIRALRKNGFNNKIILGGHQISYIRNIEKDYPDCQIFILGYGEESLLQSIFLNDSSKPILLNTEPNFDLLPSPYLTNNIGVENNQEKVRLETKRGCPYKCSFCAHRDLQHAKVYYHSEQKVFEELFYLRNKYVKKINIIDPVFNVGSGYIRILEKCVQIGLESLVTLQTRFENIRGKDGDKFLELCSALNVSLEFGLQTIHKKEMQVLNRENDLVVVKEVLRKLTKLNIPYEVNLLFGIPNQDLDSFKSSISFLKEKGCSKIKAYPLIALKGTLFWHNRKKWRCIESPMGNFRIPLIVSTNSFNKYEWSKMKQTADNLNKKKNYI